MDVFDSSVWLWGLLTDRSGPNRLIDDVLRGDRAVAVSAYIHDEVTTGLATADGVKRADISDAQMKFNSTIADLDNVVFPDQEEIGRTYAADVRNQPAMGVLATVLEIQRKDAPILVFAADLGDDTTLHVADSGFSLSPADHNLTGLDIVQVPVTE
jgi:hypothetical protein